MGGESDNQGNGGADRTVFSPNLGGPTSEPPQPASVTSGPFVTQPGQPRPIQVGDVLNHIFEVKRFIARGGMGEVFEGSNVNSDERVAIKVMLPSLAADPNVQAMFRKEARTLTKLTHPALVQYRVLAQEPNLGVFYIVTEFVDGQNLSDVLGNLNPTESDLSKLMKRLAEGLRVAHDLGAIHRDISPDNVMLEGGKLEGAKIIDFGIAKDLDPGSATIVGDGFAGKLNYVAPEQLGDFGRSIGPWTDVYSLGLLVLAVASRKDVNMGGTLVDAVDKRRRGAELDAAPAALRPILEKMLKPNPEDRYRSMSEVLAALRDPPKAAEIKAAEVKAPDVKAPDVKAPDAKPVEAKDEKKAKPADAPVVVAPLPPVAAKPAAPAPVADKKKEEVKKTAPTPPPLKPVDPNAKSRLPLFAGLGGAGLLAIAAVAYFTMGGSDPVAKDPGKTQVVNVPPPADPVSAARTALDKGLSAVSCSWLDVDAVEKEGNGLKVALRGVAGRPVDAQAKIDKLLAGTGIKAANIDFKDVSPIEASECGPLDSFRQVRDVAGDRVSVAQKQFEMAPIGGGQSAAKAVINFNLSDPAGEVALFGLEPSGEISQIAGDRQSLMAASSAIGGGQYRLTLDVTHAGWSGLLLLSGNKPFDAKLLEGPAGSRAGDWSQRFLAAAKERNWKAEMEWFQTVDQQK